MLLVRPLTVTVTSTVPLSFFGIVTVSLVVVAFFTVAFIPPKVTMSFVFLVENPDPEMVAVEPGLEVLLVILVMMTVEAGFTVIVAVSLSANPHSFVMRTQYSVVLMSCGVEKMSDVAPATGCDEWPLGPLYHWYVKGPLPVGPTPSVTDWPDRITWLAGCWLIDTGMQPEETSTVAVELSTVPQAFKMRTQYVAATARERVSDT